MGFIRSHGGNLKVVIQGTIWSCRWEKWRESCGSYNSCIWMSWVER